MVIGITSRKFRLSTDVLSSRNKTSVESFKLGKTLESSKVIRMSSPMLFMVNFGHHRRLFGSSYLCEESSHTKSRTIPFLNVEKFVVVDFSVKL